MRLTDHVATVLARRSCAGGPLRIAQAGHPALRARMRPWRAQLPTAQLLELIEAMTVTMREAPGVGIAAPQVGIPLRLFLLEDPVGGESGPDGSDDPLERRTVPLRALVNARYEELGPEDGSAPRELVYAWEGCLSVSGWQSIVPRSRRIRLRGQEITELGDIREVDEIHHGWPARIYQHEIDHLGGILCHDRAVPRSFVAARYASRCADLTDAVATLGLEGAVAQLAPGQVRVRPPR